MSIIGTTLKEKREQLGYSVEEISEITTIQQRYIHALEQNDFDSIPGEYYVKSFMKQYATILKLDSSKLIKAYEKHKAQEEQADLTHTQTVSMNDEALQSADVLLANKPTMVSEHTANTMYSEQSVKQTDEKQNKRLIWPVIFGVGIVLSLFVLPNLVRSLMPAKTTNTISVTTTTTTALSTSSSQETTTTQTSSESTTSETTTVQTTQQPVETTSHVSQAPAQPTKSQSQPVQHVLPVIEPTHNADLLTVSTDASQTTYALGQSFKQYNGEYTLQFTPKELTWIRAKVYGQVVYEGMVRANSTQHFKALNNAETFEIRMGVTQGATLVLNGNRVVIPAGNRVQTITINLKR